MMQNMFEIAGSGMTTNKAWMDVTSNNLANMETTRTDRGGPYERQSVTITERKGFDEVLESEVSKGSQIDQIHKDDNVRVVYDPEHPDSNEEGYVEYPEINITAEMTNLLTAQRGYESNSTVLDTAKKMAEKTLEIGR